MERELLRTGLGGSALTAWLARHKLVQAAPSPPSLLDGLGQWLGWADAIALSTSLNMAARADVAAASPALALEREFDRVQQSLRRAIDSDGASPPQALRRPAQQDALAADAGFAPHRQRYIALQQAMESSIGPLRTKARAAVSRLSPQLQRLAAVDAVMENLLAERQQGLLTRLPTLLETHFERQRRAHPDAAEAAWLPRFRTDMQQLALTELQLRLQPVQGLIDTLRSTPKGLDEQTSL